jgi:SAM-dependent methyltransferase
MIDPHVNNPKSPKFHVKKYLHSIREELKDKIVLDIPAGNGVTTEILLELGSKPEAFDLFPEYFLLKEVECKKADITQGLPVGDHYADYVICQEGIEHFSDQVKAFMEFNRVLKKGGKLIITTPSYSNLKARLSYMLFESEYFHKLMPPNEIDSVWFGNAANSKEIYYGHIFLIGMQKMRVIGKLTGFAIHRINFMRVNKTSLWLFPLYYPFILFASWFTYYKLLRKAGRGERAARKKVYREQLKINISVKTLLDTHSFVVFEKENDPGEIYDDLNALSKPLCEIL